MIFTNAGTDESDIKQNRITAYLVTALQRKRWEYLSRLHEIQRNELSSAGGDMGELRNKAESPFMGIEGVQTGNERLDEILDQFNGRDLQILIGLLVLNSDYDTLAAKLGISKSAAYTAYHRMMQRIRRELGISE